MKNEFKSLRDYLKEAKSRNWNNGSNSYILEKKSIKAVDKIKAIKVKLNNAEEIMFCDNIIKKLEKISVLLELYGYSAKRDLIIGDEIFSDKIRDNLMINLSKFLDYFDELDVYYE